jgi:hypothetical protein
VGGDLSTSGHEREVVLKSQNVNRKRHHEGGKKVLGEVIILPEALKQLFVCIAIVAHHRLPVLQLEGGKLRREKTLRSNPQEIKKLVYTIQICCIPTL